VGAVEGYVPLVVQVFYELGSNCVLSRSEIIYCEALMLD
jgi:hypothetical protein